VLLIDTTNDLEIIGEALSLETNFSHQSISNLEEAQKFAKKVGFPEHKLVIIEGGKITKGVGDFQSLAQIVSTATQPIQIETDMRAMNNPTRMKVIVQATQDLVNKLNSKCPNCSKPGFSVVEIKRGLPCGWCSAPTDLMTAEIYRCQHCGFEQLLPTESRAADPMYCAFCNP
jgi:DNA-directed RNA polymerase subunit RPC12/RpoP